MRMRKKKNLIPRMQRCAAYWIEDPAGQIGNWRARMPEAAELHLELGCGKGRFTCEMAGLHPDTLFIAVERVADAMVIAMERAMALERSNVFFLDGDAEDLQRYVAPAEVDRIYINFCDPWPGQRSAKRRLTHLRFLARYHELLREGGELHFKTDNQDLFSYSLFQFPKAGFRLTEVTRDLHGAGVQGVMTDYEEKFHAAGLPICRCVAAKETPGDTPPPI